MSNRPLLAKVPSKTMEKVSYYIRRETDGSISCTCPHYVHRRAKCKHIVGYLATLPAEAQPNPTDWLVKHLALVEVD